MGSVRLERARDRTDRLYAVLSLPNFRLERSRSLSLARGVPKNLARRTLLDLLGPPVQRQLAARFDGEVAGGAVADFHFGDFPVRGGDRDALRYGVSLATPRSRQLAEGTSQYRALSPDFIAVFVPWRGADGFDRRAGWHPR
jgi:hypothetical protein